MSSTDEQSGQNECHVPEFVTSRDGQVSLILKLLTSKGPGAAADIRLRIEQGRSIRARGQEFDSSVLVEALQRWELENGIQRTPAMPASWSERVNGTMHAPSEERRSSSEDVGDTAPSQRAASSKLKRGRAGLTVGCSPTLEADSQPATSRAFVSTSPTARKIGGSFCQFLEASRKRRSAGEGSSDKSFEHSGSHGRRLHSTSADVRLSSLTKTASGITAARRVVGAEPPADGDLLYTTPSRSRLPGKNSPSDGRLSATPTQWTAGSAIPAQVSPMPRHAKLSPLRKRPAPSQSPDLISPPRKQRPVASPSQRVDPSPVTIKKVSGLPQGAGDQEPQAKTQAPSSEPVPEPFPDTEAIERGATVKGLKDLLAKQGIDYFGCVEKSELTALWVRFMELRKQPLASLQASCAAAGGPHFSDADSSARFLLAQSRAREQQSQHSEPAQVVPQTSLATSSLQGACPARDKEADNEVSRIMSLRRQAFRCAVDWGFAVLGANRDATAVQRSYRVLMRKLHPDKVSQSDKVEKAIELIREAKDLCEKNLLRVEPPSHPKSLRWEVLDQTPGRRRYRLCWIPPAERAAAPVRRYLVAALDPSYGKPLTITVLEPDYSEEQKRFVAIHELTSFVLAESELQKMPSLWNQQWATVQIAAANEAGQSGWSKLDVPLVAESRRSLSRSDSSPASSCSDSSLDERSGFGHLEFETQLRRRSGSDLRSWLHGQLKAPLVSWLKTLRMPTAGTKDDLVERVLGVMGLGGR
eukprot:TRINITY_DN27289_c0_g1_i1.p1 TRINITY_DN27289_c0_g1~~TRINITY_DN27289_c0_g1_i1.p1  ORF type:complete len:756 (+),score=111.21 TRINITY_DN27289_c0_g1_i1:115-2382(+)